MKHSPKKVLLGMSGGVDSSVSAVLLLETGYEVIGAFMKNWSDCDWRAEKRDAMRVAAQLGIDFIELDFEKEYKELVVENLYSEYAAGRTPNPDVLCNKYIKFDLFVKAADKMGCDFVATGHYARVVDGKLVAGSDSNKDQTYFLWAMPKDVLARTLFPVGEIKKPEVRKIAKKHNLSVAEKKDSTGICFVGEIDVKQFLKERIDELPGPVITTDGKEVGKHDGLAFHTIGQRQGLGIGGGTPYYVVRKEYDTNTLIVGSEVDPELFLDKLTASQLNWLVDLPPFCEESSTKQSPDCEFDCLARIRYRQSLEKAHVELQNGTISVTFENPQRAITPGQSIVMYREDGTVIGGGIIE